MVRKRNYSKYDGKKLEWFSMFKFVIVIAIASLLFIGIVVGISRVDGESMMPTLKNSQVITYWRLSNDFERGDIIAIKMPSGEKYVKRVIGTPGDEIDIRDGEVYLNGDVLDEPYIQGITKAYKGVKYPFTVGEDQLFVMGDNREKSVDSRSFGPIINKNVKGRLLFRK